ncbi:hypothetical protein PENTCL1PPCAC_30234, partial [Pristionchus entomophagus]
PSSATSSLPMQDLLSSDRRKSSNYFIETCKQLFGIDSDQIQKSVESTNAYYGGRDYYEGTNVIFSHGTQDPWSAITKRSDPKHWSVVIVKLMGGMHCQDIKASCFLPTATCTDNMKQIQTLTLENIRRWLDPVFPVPDRVDITDNIGQRPQFLRSAVQSPIPVYVNSPNWKLRAKRSAEVPKKSRFTNWKQVHM